MKSRIEKLVDQMVRKNLIHDDEHSRATQIAECSTWKENQLIALEVIVTKNLFIIPKKKIGD